MSAKYTFWAWDQPITKAPLKLTLLQLADNANDDGVSWYSVPKMAKKCGMSERALQGHLITLSNMGLLKVNDRPGTSRVYCLQYQEAILLTDPRRNCATPPQNLHPTPAESADDPNNEPNNESDSNNLLSVDSENSSIEVREVLDYLNSVTGYSYKASTRSHAQHISGRLSDGHSVDDLKRVIDEKASEWLHDKNMCLYLRPQTLFSASKFQGYLRQANTEKTRQHDARFVSKPSNDIPEGFR